MKLNVFFWMIENRLAGMDHPGDEQDAFEELRSHGIGAVVTLTERPLPQDVLEAQGMDYLHVPIQDYHPPGQDQIDRFVAFCDEHISAGRAVAVHCLAGRGRTGTMLACYLVHGGAEPGEAINAVRGRRPGAIETAEQEDAIFEFAARTEAGPGSA